MKKLSRQSPEVQVFLRALGNPYASTQMFEDDERTQPEAAHEYRLRGNPYAKLTLTDTTEIPAPPPIINLPLVRSAQPANPTLSKVEFRARAKRIFTQYIPTMERGQLRGHHRDFITRNESCSPIKRFRLIKALEKYDISALQGLIPQFNRERDTLTERKLKEVERLADDES
jgi:hypothetical protein